MNTQTERISLTNIRSDTFALYRVWDVECSGTLYNGMWR